MDKNCVIIKKKELSDLYSEINDLKKEHAEEVMSLQDKLNKAKEAVKPDEIEVKIFVYKETGHYMGDRFALVGSEVSHPINLSTGIRKQVRRILRDIHNTTDNIYKEKYEKLNKRLEHEYKIEKARTYMTLHDFFNRFLFYKKSTIIKKLKEVFD